MYIILSDRDIINDGKRNYTYATGTYYESIAAAFSDIENIKEEDINQILLFSLSKNDNTKKAKSAECSKIEHLSDGIRIYLKSIKTEDITCEEVRRHLYGHSIKRGITKQKEQLLTLYIVSDINEYNYIKGQKVESKFQSLMEKAIEYQKCNKWDEIIALFPTNNEIENTDYWEEVECLNVLSFALSMSLGRKYDVRNEKYFLKLIERCLELEPNHRQTLSTKAYFYYNRYCNSKNKKIDDYKIAREILFELKETSYKEKYRYIKLQEAYYENNAFKGNISIEEWSSKVNEVIDGYKGLTKEDYDALKEDDKKKFKNYYIKALYGLAAFSIDELFNYWDIYFNWKVGKKEIKQIMISSKYDEKISDIESTLQQLTEYCDINNPTIDLINEKPSYFDIQYRMAQIYQIRGIFEGLRGNKEHCYDYFRKSNEIIEKLFEVATKYRNNENAKFSYPNHTKKIQAINYYYLGDNEKCHNCFYRAKVYMQYEEARLYVLQKEVDKAIQILQMIPSNDKCFNKSQRLLEFLKNEYK